MHRIYAASVEHEEDYLTIDGKKVAVTRKSTPAEIPWRELGVDIVLETSGKFKKKTDFQGHLDSGAKKVVIGAPAPEADGMFVMGVNHKQYDPATQNVVSAASCTTNCLAPLAKVLNDSFGLEHGLMTTIHAYTMSQRILDGSSKDIRRARAAAMSMIPTTTGAAIAVTKVLPELVGKLDGFSIRVPTPDVSLVDLTCRLGKEVDAGAVNQALKEAADSYLKNVLYVTEAPLVSVDYTGSTYSSVVDAPLTQVMAGRMVKVLSWYDNEMGFTNRLVDLADHVAQSL